MIIIIIIILYKGKEYVGILSALIVLSGAMISFPISKVANQYGKNLVMIFGCGYF